MSTGSTPSAEQQVAALRTWMDEKAARFSAAMFPVRAANMKFSGRDILAVLDGREPELDDF